MRCLAGLCQEDHAAYGLFSNATFDDFACGGIIAHPACYVQVCGFREDGVGVVAVWGWGEEGRICFAGRGACH